MIRIITDNVKYIEVSMQDCGATQRFPNQMLWNINTYLSKCCNLYEYYLSKKENGDFCLQISRRNNSKKFLCFSRLAPSYVSLIDYDENEYEIEYKKHKNEFESYEQFFEHYSMEEIAELNYVAVDNMQDLITGLRKSFSKTYFVLQKNIAQKIDLNSDVSIHIGDHCYMKIVSKHPEIIAELLNIIKLY